MKSRFPALAAAIAMGAVPIAMSVDVPWVFDGDTTRNPAAAVSASSPLATFVSWTHDSSEGESTAIRFSSFKPGTFMIFR